MEVIDPGHLYRLNHIDGNGTSDLQFVKRIPEDQKTPGVTIQEVMRALIDRLFFLYRQVPCQETQEVIVLLRQALVLMESRAARRTLEKILQIEDCSVCSICGHIMCLCHSKE